MTGPTTSQTAPEGAGADLVSRPTADVARQTEPARDSATTPRAGALAAGGSGADGDGRGASPSARWRRRRRTVKQDVPSPTPSDHLPTTEFEFDVAPNDALVAFCQQAGGAVDVETLELDSPALRQLKAAGVRLVVPLVTQGELIGLLSLGPRLSERDYSGDDRRLLDTLAGYAAPAVRVGQLVREQEAELVARERIEQELHVAQLIQQQFLPKHVPDLPSWHIAAFYRPARTVGGDFYDFIALPDGRVFIVVGDVTDKGVPAALVMASTHSILRASAARLVSPGEVLERANDVLFDDIPPHMFVTCLAMVLDPATGVITYANAGHDLPYVRTKNGVQELRATGMPLGLMAGMSYEEKVAVLEPGDTLLLHSDGIAEAHAPDREMFGFPRLKKLMEAELSGEELIDRVLTDLAGFVGPGADQEDDITMVTLERSAAVPPATASSETVLTDFTLASEPGNERDAMARVADVVAGLGLSGARLKALETAVAEATMNAIEHGNGNRPEVAVRVRVTTVPEAVRVAITDQGGLAESAAAAPVQPDLEAKLAGLQSPRGWGLFLIKNMVDDLTVHTEGSDHTVVLSMQLVENRGLTTESEVGNAEHL